MKRSVLLDVARSIAVLMVIAHHVGYRISPGVEDELGILFRRIGWVGVDLFFVISGYFVATILFSHRETLRGFLLRRFFRIVPLYQVAASLFVAFTLLGLSSESLRHSWALFGFLTAFTASFNLAEEIPFLITWSITVELFFYGISALFFVFDKRKFLTLFFIIYVSSFLVRLILLHLESAPAGLFYFFPLFRLDGFAVGFILYFAVQSNLFNLYLGGAVTALSATAVVWLVSHSSIQSTAFIAGGYTFVAIMYGFFCFGLISIESALRKRNVNLNRCLHVLITIGQRSYFFYLFHLFFIAFISTVGNYLVINRYLDSIPGFWLTLLAVLLLLYLTSWFSWVYFEKPLIDYSRKF